LAHLFQVGAGSGGMTVLDIVCRDPRITHVTLVEPDVYGPHNVVRHLFPQSSVGFRKADLARQWLYERRPELLVDLLPRDLLDAGSAAAIAAAVQACDLGVCAADNEPAKYHFDLLMRRHCKPWTLGEVLSGGIGGMVHWFAPGLPSPSGRGDGGEGMSPCYGCVASHLRRAVVTDTSKPPDYSAPGGPAPETTIPASRASIEVIASLHAQITLQLLTHGAAYDPGFTSLLFTLEKVAGIFDEAFRTHRFRIPRSPECLICRAAPAPQNLDAAVDDALARLNRS
jgi:hypothetical protein